MNIVGYYYSDISIGNNIIVPKDVLFYLTDNFLDKKTILILSHTSKQLRVILIHHIMEPILQGLRTHYDAVKYPSIHWIIGRMEPQFQINFNLKTQSKFQMIHFQLSRNCHYFGIATEALNEQNTENTNEQDADTIPAPAFLQPFSELAIEAQNNSEPLKNMRFKKHLAKLCNAGLFDGALEEARQLPKLMKKIKALHKICRALIHIGDRQGAREAADLAFDEATETASSCGKEVWDWIDVCKIYIQMGDIDDLQKAREAADLAFDATRKLDKTWVRSWKLTEVCKIYIQIGEIERARMTADLAFEETFEIEDSYDRSNAWVRVCNIYIQIGEVVDLQKAREAADLAITAAVHEENDPLEKAELLINVYSAYIQIGDTDDLQKARDAADLIFEATAIINQLDDPLEGLDLLIDACTKVYIQMGDRQRAREAADLAFEIAIKEFNDDDDFRDEKIDYLINICKIYIQIDDLEKARELAQCVFEELALTTGTLLGVPSELIEVCQLYIQMGDRQRAREIAQSILDRIHEKSDLMSKSRGLVEVSPVYMQMGDLQIAREIVDLAFETIRETSVTSTSSALSSSITITLIKVCKAYFQMGDLQRARMAANLALEEAKGIHFLFRKINVLDDIAQINQDLENAEAQQLENY